MTVPLPFARLEFSALSSAARFRPGTLLLQVCADRDLTTLTPSQYLCQLWRGFHGQLKTSGRLLSRSRVGSVAGRPGFPYTDLSLCRNDKATGPTAHVFRFKEFGHPSNQVSSAGRLQAYEHDSVMGPAQTCRYPKNQGLELS